MTSANFALLSSELSALRSYLKMTSSIRQIQSLIQERSEPSLLEDLLQNSAAASPDSVRWRTMDHVLTISRLYSVYEVFCERASAEWIEFLSQNLLFDKLPEKTQSSYRFGFNTVLSMLPSPRFPLLNVSSLVSNFSNALAGKKGYQLDSECLIFHKSNLRWSELCELLSRCGIDNFSQWVSRSQNIVEFFDGNPDRLVDQVTSKIDQFVQYRNDCSHGLVEVDEILGHDELISLIDFVFIVCEAVQSFVDGSRFSKLHEWGALKECGEVTEHFPKAGAIIVRASGETFTTGQCVIAGTKQGFSISEIQSIQLDGKSHASVKSEIGQELGLRLSLMPKLNSKLFLLPD